MTSYETIFNRALQKITDYELAFVPEEDMEAMLCGWLLSAIVKFRKCASDLKQRDDENKTFLVDLVDEEIEILALLIATEWLENQIQSCLLTRQMYGGKEEKYYSQSSHLATLMALREANRTEARKLMRDYTYANSSYFNSQDGAVMIYKYGILPSEQIKQQKLYLQNSIYQLLCFKEEKYEFLDARFTSLLQQLDGLNRLFNEQPVIITIMSLLETARHEDDFTKYRKAVLDATALVSKIEDGDVDV